MPLFLALHDVLRTELEGEAAALVAEEEGESEMEGVVRRECTIATVMEYCLTSLTLRGMRTMFGRAAPLVCRGRREKAKIEGAKGRPRREERKNMTKKAKRRGKRAQTRSTKAVKAW